MGRDHEQIETTLVTAERVMSHPYFARGVDDARAGKGFPRSYDEWSAKDDLWAYERGRAWAQLAPRNVPLKKDGRLTREAIDWFCKFGQDIL